MTADIDEKYRELLLSPIRTCASYLPKMGGGVEVNFEGFATLYGGDPFYRWVGLDTAPMFAAHKAAGGMTSVYRQLGIGSERLVREILKDSYGLTASQVVWSYEMVEDSTTGGDAKTKLLTLDGRVDLADVKNENARDNLATWISYQKKRLNVTIDLKGVVLEVRQGYKSADSKRQNADLTNASQALGHGYLPVLVIMSTQINRAVFDRYTASNWSVLRGTLESNPMTSTFAFLRDVVGYDIVSFFERNTELIRDEVSEILSGLLEAK